MKGLEKNCGLRHFISKYTFINQIQLSIIAGPMTPKLGDLKQHLFILFTVLWSRAQQGSLDRLHVASADVTPLDPLRDGALQSWHIGAGAWGPLTWASQEVA